ncbi:MAG: sensor histidine kinase [Propionibacteriaceae bacterium]|nr:sensor histidine kinase [Propionibacteriaceae bacterium]
MLSVPAAVADDLDLTDRDLDFLDLIVAEWHLLADLSFSDLILWVPGQDDNEFFAIAQIRPSTGPTALTDDVVGDSISYDPEALVTEAYLSQRITSTSNNKLQAGIPVDISAIPVRHDGRVIAVVERHTNQMGVRAPGELEDNYLAIAELLADMLWRGQWPDNDSRNVTVGPRVGEGLIWVDPQSVVSYASPNAVSIYRKLGLSGDLIGEPLIPLTLSLLTKPGEPIDRGVEAHFRSRSTQEFEITGPGATAVVRTLALTRQGRDAGKLVVYRDATELRHKERQLVTKNATIREIHHRVKNNLQTVSALLRLQARRMTSVEAAEALREAVARVQAIAIVHEILSRSFSGTVQFDDIADRLLRLSGEVAAPRGRVQGLRDGSFGAIPAEVATALSLIITELCQNAIEHGLEAGSGTIVLAPRHLGDDRLEVSVIDYGQGLPAGFQIDDQNRQSLGLSIVSTLVADLDGSFRLEPNPDGIGARAIVTVRLPNARESHGR